jgi:ABC-2 type transport system permease protein
MIAAPVFLSAHYAASWQDNILLFAMLFVSGFAASAVALLLGILIRFNPWVLLMPVMWVLLFCSGTFSKQVVIEGVTTLMPPFLIQNAAFELTLFANGAPAVIVLLVSLAVIAASAVVGGLLYNGRKVTQ